MPAYLELPVIKKRLRIDFADDDDFLTSLLDAAESYLTDPESGVLWREISPEDMPEQIKNAGYYIASHFFEHGVDGNPDTLRKMVALMIAGHRRVEI